MVPWAQTVLMWNDSFPCVGTKSGDSPGQTRSDRTLPAPRRPLSLSASANLGFARLWPLTSSVRSLGLPWVTLYLDSDFLC